MHEMPYTQSIIELALEASKGKQIDKIYLRVGRLSAIVPKSVQVFFDVLSKKTPAEGAELIFEMEAITLTCRNCQATLSIDHDENLSTRESLAGAFRKGCSCHKADFTVSSGLGFDLDRIEVS